MPDFTYEALARTGHKSTGTLTANSEREAAHDARRPRAVPRQDRAGEDAGVRAAAASVSASGSRAAHLATFYSQLADLLHSGVPLLRSLDILERQSTNPTLQAVHPRRPRRKVADGTGLAEAMALAPARVQRTGRQHGPRRPGGRLPRRRAQAHRRLHRAPGRPEGQGRSARWPTRSSSPSPASLVLNILVIFFVPKFEPIFEKLKEKGELPALTTVPDGLQPLPAVAGWAS